MNVLVVGSGGREHAMAWKLAQTRHVSRIFCAPGNAGIAEIADCVPISASEIGRLVGFARENRIGLTVVGPEAPLAAGIVNEFRAAGLRIFGPTREAARIESSKVFAKKLLQKHAIPTADARIFDDAEAANRFVRSKDAPVVVKADGLAGGKGTFVAKTPTEAEAAIELLMAQKKFGDAGRRIVIEERLRGEEITAQALVSGESVVMLAAARDYKRLLDGDRGPNTGGMGAVSPSPTPTEGFREKIREIFLQTLRGLCEEGIEYSGVLYAGLMLTEEGPKVLEFNCRFGDPEAQVILPRMNFDLLEALEAVVDGNLNEFQPQWSKEACVCVVMAARGYPDAPVLGDAIDGLQAARQLDKVIAFHAGTRRENGRVVTAGGRVLGVCGMDETIEAAARRAYQAVAQISFAGAQFRRDIAARAPKSMA